MNLAKVLCNLLGRALTLQGEFCQLQHDSCEALETTRCSVPLEMFF